jgi:hypothetical protein
VAGTCNIYDIQAVNFNDTVQVGINKVESRGSPPVTEETRLYMFELQRLSKERIVHEINLAH